MLISPAGNILFIHVPRTAGTSLRRVLEGFESPEFVSRVPAHLAAGGRGTHQLHWHYSAQSAAQLIDDSWLRDAFRFALVRNPWERLYSRWNFLWQTEHYTHSAAGVRKAVAQDFKQCGFEAWLYEGEDFVQSSPDSWCNIADTPQLEWLDDGGELRFPGIVGRYEELESAVNVLAKKLGRKMILPRAGKTARSDYRKVYTSAMADVVADRFRRDIECYNYRFE